METAWISFAWSEKDDVFPPIHANLPLAAVGNLEVLEVTVHCWPSSTRRSLVLKHGQLPMFIISLLFIHTVQEQTHVSKAISPCSAFYNTTENSVGFCGVFLFVL